MSNGKLYSEHLGFGVLTPNHCVIYDSNELAGIMSGKKSIDSIKPVIELDFEDFDAMPFGLISIQLPNKSKITTFCVGEHGASHNAMICQALKFAIKNDTDCANNATLRSHLNISYSGRIWHKSKIIILKSYDSYAKEISVIRELLRQKGIDISQYKLLLCKNDKVVDNKYSGDIIAYNIIDLCYPVIIPISNIKNPS